MSTDQTIDTNDHYYKVVLPSPLEKVFSRLLRQQWGNEKGINNYSGRYSLEKILADSGRRTYFSSVLPGLDDGCCLTVSLPTKEM